jgi:hypothetical protein
MDIYKYAEEINYSADYYDEATDRLYYIRDYGIALERELNPEGIGVTTKDGWFIGVLKRNDCNN